jgi:hypothetical protein
LAAQEVVTTRGPVEDDHDSLPGAYDLRGELAVATIVGYQQTDPPLFARPDNTTDAGLDSRNRITIRLVARARDERRAIEIDGGIDHRRKIQSGSSHEP